MNEAPELEVINGDKPNSKEKKLEHIARVGQYIYFIFFVGGAAVFGIVAWCMLQYYTFQSDHAELIELKRDMQEQKNFKASASKALDNIATDTSAIKSRLYELTDPESHPVRHKG